MSQYITNIDEAHQRLNALEAQLGLPKSDFIANWDEVNAKVQALEAKVQARRNAPQTAPNKQPVVKPLPNDLAAVKRSGKVFGISKAMIAATERTNLQSK